MPKKPERNTEPERTATIGPSTASPMLIEEMIGPTLADIPAAREAFGLEPKRTRSGTVTGGGR